MMDAYRKIIVLLLTILSTQVLAQGTPKLSLWISEQKANMTLEESTGNIDILYFPGDTIHYSITATNVGDGIMTQPTVVDPIPDGVSYVAGSAKGEGAIITFSINGGQTYVQWPPTYTTRDVNGKVVVLVAQPDMVTHIKWEIVDPLEPESKKDLAFDVLVKQ